MSTIPAKQIPGVYHRRFGDFLVTALSDGYVEMGYHIFREFEPDDVDRMMARDHRISPPRISVNCFLLRGPAGTVLIDCGSQDKFGPTAGKLFENLAAAEVDPAEVEHVLLTHCHPDHSCGLTDVKTGARLFPNATVIANRKEIEHWYSDAEMAAADERKRERYFGWTREQIDPYRNGRLRLAEDGEEVLPGIRLVECAGHTPGHSTWLISSQGKQMIVWGDLAHVPEIQVARPEVSMSFDHDPDMAARNRMALLARILEEDMLVAGMHIHFPGFGWLLREGSGYRVATEQWSFEI
ncbi:MBL fold metallo-hydrolase [Falsochrobactrum shanghaiense]|uniref:MBL fold metallo-hydrolase n=1 Tax=Falsochrobactrum shanghaiense TaxID=2201899 RepID=A0A316JUV6_9HYPH|nr:MBL fold metallo-hydrolase [Falsochrobactrum shanghaiense]PWL18950.1 MBL fold metallo-hydrolase [Falsochrobactrum shanghaiense]